MAKNLPKNTPKVPTRRPEKANLPAISAASSVEIVLLQCAASQAEFAAAASQNNHPAVLYCTQYCSTVLPVLSCPALSRPFLSQSYVVQALAPAPGEAHDEVLPADRPQRRLQQDPRQQGLAPCTMPPSTVYCTVLHCTVLSTVVLSCPVLSSPVLACPFLSQS